MQQRSTLTIDDTTLVVIVERKAVKHINARLKGTELLVSAPLRLAQTALDQAIPILARRLLRRVRAREINDEVDALALVQAVAKRFPQPPTVTMVQFSTHQESRWGSYSARTRTIRLHAALRHMPTWVMEAVVAHELAHVFHFDHSPAFWKLLRNVYPDTDRADAFLAGVSWLANVWEDLPPVERSQLERAAIHGGPDGTNAA